MLRNCAAVVVTVLLFGAFAGVVVGQYYWGAPLGGDGTTMNAGGGLIVFASDRSGFWDIWVVRGDGGFPQNLTNDPAEQGWPDVSMDGRQIVFMTDPDGNGLYDLEVMNIDGSRRRLLTSEIVDGRDYWQPSWLPDCHRVVFYNAFDNRLYIIDVNAPPISGGLVIPVEPNAPAGGYSDLEMSVGSGDMVEIRATSDQWVRVHTVIVDNENHIMLYVTGDACYQTGIPATCGFPNFPLTVRLVENPDCHVSITKSPQYIDPGFFGSCWTGKSSQLEFILADTKRDDNSGKFVIYMIPYPVW